MRLASLVCNSFYHIIYKVIQIIDDLSPNHHSKRKTIAKKETKTEKANEKFEKRETESERKSCLLQFLSHNLK